MNNYTTAHADKKFSEVSWIILEKILETDDEESRQRLLRDNQTIAGKSIGADTTL